MTESQVDAIVEQADVLAVEAEAREAEEKRAKKAAAAVAAVEAKRVAAEQQLQAQAASASEEAAVIQPSRRSLQSPQKVRTHRSRRKLLLVELDQ